MYRAYREQTINLLKHRILAFLYRRAEAIAASQGTPYEVRRFYQYFDQVTTPFPASVSTRIYF